MKPIGNKLTIMVRQMKAFQDEELPVWDAARDMMQGRAYTTKANDREAAFLRCSLNILFAIVESAISALLPRNPQVTAALADESDPKLSSAPEAYVNEALKLTDFKQEQRLALTDAVLCGRSTYKTTWDDQTGYPRVRAVDPRLHHFDPTARRVKDIRYHFELTLLSEEEFRSRVTNRQYRLTDGKDAEDIKGTKYPAFLTDNTGDSQPKQYRDIMDWQPWVQVYEFYDLQSNTVSHWCEQVDAPLMVTRLTYNPYTILTLNHNGQDCRGLSEALLTKSNIQDVDECMTMWLNIVRRQQPHLAYDSGVLTEDEVHLWQKSRLGDLSPLNGKGRPISELFAALPVPNLPPDMKEYQQKLEGNISYVSALADNARGQISGAKTATELALIQASLQNRLAGRQSEVDAATVDVATKVIFLGANYLKGSKRIKGSKEWLTLTRKSLACVQCEFSVIAYSPLEENRAVIEERWFKALEYMSARSEQFDWDLIDQQFIKMFRLDTKLLKPKAVTADQQTEQVDVATIKQTPEDVLAEQQVQLNTALPMNPTAAAAQLRSQAVNATQPTGSEGNAQ